jgi:hypothetical protein
LSYDLHNFYYVNMINIKKDMLQVYYLKARLIMKHSALSDKLINKIVSNNLPKTSPRKSPSAVNKK